ncbi:MAG: hypothetical protein U0547_12485 [Dehalococcoidia bacterium]
MRHDHNPPDAHPGRERRHRSREHGTPSSMAVSLSAAPETGRSAYGDDDGIDLHRYQTVQTRIAIETGLVCRTRVVPGRAWLYSGASTRRTGEGMESQAATQMGENVTHTAIVSVAKGMVSEHAVGGMAQRLDGRVRGHRHGASDVAQERPALQGYMVMALGETKLGFLKMKRGLPGSSRTPPATCWPSSIAPMSPASTSAAV